MKLFVTSVMIKVITIASGYILVIFAQNYLSIHDSSVLYRMISIIPFISIFLLYGLDFFVVQKFSGCVPARSNIYSGGIFLLFAKKIFYRSVAILLGASLLVSAFGEIGNYEVEYLLYSIVFATCVSIIILIGEIHKCMGRYFIGSVVVSSLIPMLCVIAFYVFKLNVEMTLMLAYFITLVLYLIFSIYIKNSVTEVIVPTNYDAHNNLNSSIVFFATGLSQLILMLPTFFASFILLDRELAIIYPILRFSLLFQTGLAAVNVYLGPKLSRAFKESSIPEFVYLSRIGSTVGLISCVLFITITIIFNKQILMLFAINHEYKVLLYITLIGQSISAITGPVLLSLIHSENELSVVTVNIITGIIAIIILPLLYSLLGLIGFCLATSLIIAGLNLYYLVFLKIKQGFWIYPKFYKPIVNKVM